MTNIKTKKKRKRMNFNVEILFLPNKKEITQTIYGKSI